MIRFALNLHGKQIRGKTVCSQNLSVKTQNLDYYQIIIIIIIMKYEKRVG